MSVVTCRSSEEAPGCQPDPGSIYDAVDRASDGDGEDCGEEHSKHKRRRAETPAAAVAEQPAAAVVVPLTGGPATLGQAVMGLRLALELPMRALADAAEAGQLQPGDWSRHLYQLVQHRAYGRNGAGRATTGDVDRLLAAIAALNQPRERLEDEIGQLKAALRALVEGQGSYGLKVAIVALIADNPSRESILLLFEIADDKLLKRVLDAEEINATPAHLNAAIRALAEPARAAGGEVARLAAGVLALAQFTNGRGGLCTEIRRISAAQIALVEGGQPAPERAPAPAQTSRLTAGPPWLGPAGPHQDAAAPASGSECSPSPIAAWTPAPAQYQVTTVTVAAPAGGGGWSGGRGGWSGPGEGEPPEPDMLTADFLMELIAHFKTLDKDTGRTVEKSKFRVFVRRLRGGVPSWKVVLPNEGDLNRAGAKALARTDPRCMIDEVTLRAFFAAQQQGGVGTGMVSVSPVCSV